jgi:cation:H+ antiporter
VTISCWRLGAFDMAISNLLGSNLFDMTILAVDDLFFLKGPLLFRASTLHAVSVLSAVMIEWRLDHRSTLPPPVRLFKTVGWTSLFLFSLYLLNSLVLYIYGK